MSKDNKFVYVVHWQEDSSSWPILDGVYSSLDAVFEASEFDESDFFVEGDTYWVAEDSVTQEKEIITFMKVF